MQIAILNDVVRELEKDLKQSANQGAVYATIDNYNQRLEDLILEQESNDVKEELANIRIMIMEIESEGLEYAYKKGRFQNSNTIYTNVISKAWSAVSTVVLFLVSLMPLLFSFLVFVEFCT